MDSMYIGIISPNDLQVEMNALRAYFPLSSSSSPFCSHVKTIKFEDINTTAFKQYHHHHPINNWFAHSKRRATSIYLSISKTTNPFPCILQLKNNINHTQMMFILRTSWVLNQDLIELGWFLALNSKYLCSIYYIYLISIPGQQSQFSLCFHRHNDKKGDNVYCRQTALLLILLMIVSIS